MPRPVPHYIICLIKGLVEAGMGKRAVAVSLGLTYCVVTIAWCFALVKMVAWLSAGIPTLAHSIIEQAEAVISGRPVLASSVANGHAARPQSMDCDPTESTRCVLLPSHGNSHRYPTGDQASATSLSIMPRN